MTYIELLQKAQLATTHEEAQALMRKALRQGLIDTDTKYHNFKHATK